MKTSKRQINCNSKKKDKLIVIDTGTTKDRSPCQAGNDEKTCQIIIIWSLCKLAYQASLSCAKLKRTLALL